MNRTGLKALIAATTLALLAGCASIKPSPQCIVAGAATGAIVTSGGHSEDIALGALGGAAIGTLICMAMDTGNEDSDQDGVPNRSDQCPATPINAPVDSNGCNLDIDGDGVENALDQCANTSADTKVNSVGCALPPSKPQAKAQPAPKATPEVLNAPTPVILDNLSFEFDSAILTESDIAKLLRQSETLKDSSQLHVDVVGHTDDIGDIEYNETLSLQRAKAVIQVLRENGLIKATLTPIAKGESQPLVIGKTSFARDKNRRVELKVRQTE